MAREVSPTQRAALDVAVSRRPQSRWASAIASDAPTWARRAQSLFGWRLRCCRGRGGCSNGSWSYSV